MAARDQVIIPLVIGHGEQAYIEAKRWIEKHYPNLTPQQYSQACRLAAKMAGI